MTLADLSNETFSIQALRYWWNASSNASSTVTSFEKALTYYRGQGVFMDRFGATVRTVPQDKVKAAMESLGRRSTGFPAIQDFFEYLAKFVGSLTVGEIAAAAGEGVVDAGKFALDIGKSSLLLYVGVAAFAIFILPKLPALLKEAGVR